MLPNIKLAKGRRLFLHVHVNSASSIRSLSLAKLLEAIAKHSSSKKPHIFHAYLKKILMHFLSVLEIFFVRNFRGEMLKTWIKTNFCRKINKIVATFANGQQRRKRIALTTRGADLYWALGGIICNFTLILPCFQHWGMNLDQDFFSGK